MRGYKLRSIVLFQGVFSVEAITKIKAAKTTPIFVCEGRPSLEAGKSNSKALLIQGITPTVICDNMAGFLFFKGFVREVVIACQYADGTGILCDTGGLILAVLAKKHKVALRLLEAEHKKHFLGNPKDLLTLKGFPTASKETHAYVPLVEWVPAKYLK